MHTDRMPLEFLAVMGTSCMAVALVLKTCAAFSRPMTLRLSSISASHSSLRILPLCSLALAMACHRQPINRSINQSIDR